MKFFRVDEAEFRNMKDYHFRPHYFYHDDMRMHYVDEGPGDANPILLLHGNPSWSYLYRHIIPGCVSAGNRVIAPDLIGFGKSDKLARMKNYSYQVHMDWMTSFLRSLDLNHIILFCQDWGSLIGLRLAAENKERFSGIIVSNGMLVAGDLKVPFVFKIWKYFSLLSPWLPVDFILNIGCLKNLDKEERRAYKAPFPSSKFKKGARIFPTLVPVTSRDPAAQANRRAWEVLENWHKPFLTVFGDSDPITRGGDIILQERIPGAKNQNHSTLRGGHFLQEDAGPELAEIINRFAIDVNCL